jgi:N utilization substance protein B
VVKALYAHFKSEADSMAATEKTLIAAIDKTYDLYHQMLWLVVDVARYAECRIEKGRNKKLPTQEDLNPNCRFIDNRLIRRLETSDALNAYMNKRGLGWSQYPELIKSLYNSLVETQEYNDYMTAKSVSFSDDVKIVEDFFLNEVDDNEAVYDAVEEQSILWSDDVDFALIMVLRTLNACRPNQTDIPLLPQYKSPDDRAFALELFEKTLANYAKSEAEIEKYTKNWDVDRLAFTDNIIMATAITEIVSFPSIPIKVSMDEYIEISKYYSTPGSSLFINGVLDKIIVKLKEEGRISKAGRGLL